jgi:hypothetical protein
MGRQKLITDPQRLNVNLNGRDYEKLQLIAKLSEKTLTVVVRDLVKSLPDPRLEQPAAA